MVETRRCWRRRLWPGASWRRRAWQVVESLGAFAQPAGPTVRYERFRAEILDDLRAAMPIDSVLLSPHGAIVAEGYDDAEGDLLAAVRGFVDRCAALEGPDGVLSVSIGHGFPWGDVAEMGSKIVVITDGDGAKALGRDFFRIRKETQPPYTTLDEAVARAGAHRAPEPLVIADVADSAGGAASDSTVILRRLLEAGVRNAAAAIFWDPIAVGLAHEVGLGGTLDLRIGGKLGPASGDPLDVRGAVIGLARDASIPFGTGDVTLEPVGDMAAWVIGRIALVCGAVPTQCFSTAAFTNVGIDPAAGSVLVVTSMQHFHAAFAPIAADILYAVAPGAVAPDVTMLPYRHASRWQWPFVEDPHARA
jgi:microcystin degradation protein MlrC